jgi:hypothetical protein
MAPSIACHRHPIPSSPSYSVSPSRQSREKTPASAHSWNRRWAELLEQMPVAFRAFHWQPVRRTKKMASIALRSSTRGLWHPRGWGSRGGSSGAMRSQSSSGMRQPSSTAALVAAVSV